MQSFSFPGAGHGRPHPLYIIEYDSSFGSIIPSLSAIACIALSETRLCEYIGQAREEGMGKRYQRTNSGC